MTSKPNIVIFDVETTGTDTQKDQIIELCAQFGLGSGASNRVWRIRPDVPIAPGAQAVHGISMADLKECPGFSEVADEIREMFRTADMLVGYNLRFDINMVQAEYRRLRQPALDFGEKLIVDPYRLWQNREPRSLMDAHLRFVGEEFSGAHSAEADVAATGRVLEGMLTAFGLPADWEEIADICEPDRAFWVGGSKHLRWNEEGQLTFGFGKHAGVVLSEMARGSDAGYMKWLIGKDFPDHVRLACSKALSLGAEEFVEWANAEFPKPNSKTEKMPDQDQSVKAEAADIDTPETAPVSASASEVSPSETKPDAEADPAGQQLLFDLL